MDDDSGRIVLITGATSGIGAATAMGVARARATVVLVGRREKRCVDQANRIRRAVPGARVDHLVADLSSQREIRRLASEFESRYPRLDVLVNNAGGYFGRREMSVDGIEMNFALNHLAYFLLTNLLLDRLKASRSARIVSVSSIAHANGTMNFADLQSRRGYDLSTAYAQSKLANILFTYALARRLAGTHVTANALHPGYVATNIGRNNSWIRTALRNALKRSLLHPREGARTIVYLATSSEVEGVSGEYYCECKPIRSSNESYDAEVAERLWKMSEALAGIST